MQSNISSDEKDFRAVLLGGALILLVGGYFLLRPLLSGNKQSDSETNISRSDTSVSLSSDDTHTITAEVIRQKIANGEPVTFIDIRDRTSFDVEHIPHSLHVSEGALNNFSPLKDELLVIVYAQSDTRSLEVAKNILAQKSFSAFFLQGGFEAWKKNNNQTISQGDPNSFVDQSKITYLSASDLLKLLSANDPNLVILDVQSEANFARVHLKHALHIPLDQLEKRISEVPRAGIIVVYGETDLVSFQAGVRLSDLNIFSARTLSGNSNLVPTSGLPLEP